jgi:P4 family phage/plasmid primase-like protien
MTAPTPKKGLFAEHAGALLSNGYEIVPIPAGGKGPKVPDWRNLGIRTADDLERFTHGTHEIERDGETHTVPNVRNGDGIGILTTWTPAIDVDVLDTDLAEQMEQFIRDNLDDAPLRIGKAPKRLMLFRTTSPFAKITSASWVNPKDPTLPTGKAKVQRIEVLGSGQQFVAFHIHPDTQRPYTWPNDWENPLDIPAADLPLLTEDHARAVAKEFDRLAKSVGWTKVENAQEGHLADEADALAVAAPPPESDEEVSRVKEALQHISPDCSRNEYLAVLAGLRWTGWLCAEEIALEWAEKSEEGKFDEDHFNRDWKSFKQDRGARTVTLGSLYKLAKDGGWDASRPVKPKDTTESFTELMLMVASADLTDRAAQKELLSIIAETELDALDAVDLRKAFCKAAKMHARDYERVLKEARKGSTGHETKEATHARYAKQLIERLEAQTGSEVVACEGKVWTYDKGDHLWVGRTPTEFEVDVAAAFDGMENCSRRNDYLAIANHLNSLSSAGKEQFFADAPKGMACDGRFYAVVDGEIRREPLQSHHRQRFLSSVSPKVMDTPLWDAFMARTFEGDYAREQELLLEEYVGACLVGSVPDFEKALFMYGKARAGKGTILKVIRALFPRSAVTAVNPDKWDREYYLADLASKRVNLVGELSDELIIDANAFKTVLGRDELTARHPTHRPFQFTNEAGHIFQGNHFIPTKEHTDAFYGRWLLMEFRNSMLAEGAGEINVNLAQNIIDAELPGIAARFLQGAKRLMARGKFIETRAHHRLMALWRKRSSTLMEFINDPDVCVIGSFPRIELRRSHFYDAYSAYCRSSGRRPLGKHRFYEEIGSEVLTKMGITVVCKVGNTMVMRGIALVSQVLPHEVEQANEESEW